MHQNTKGLLLASLFLAPSLVLKAAEIPSSAYTSYVDQQLQNLEQGRTLSSTELLQNFPQIMEIKQGLLQSSLIEKSNIEASSKQSERLALIDKLHISMEGNANFEQIAAYLSITSQQLSEFLENNPSFQNQFHELALILEHGSSSKGIAHNEKVISDLLENLRDWYDWNPASDFAQTSDNVLRQVAALENEWANNNSARQSEELLALQKADTVSERGILMASNIANSFIGDDLSQDPEIGPSNAFKGAAKNKGTSSNEELSDDTQKTESLLSETPSIESPVAADMPLQNRAPAQAESSAQLRNFSSSGTHYVPKIYTPSYAPVTSRPTDVFNKIPSTSNSSQSDLCANLGIGCDNKLSASSPNTFNAFVDQQRHFINSITNSLGLSEDPLPEASRAKISRTALSDPIFTSTKKKKKKDKNGKEIEDDEVTPKDVAAQTTPAPQAPVAQNPGPTSPPLASSAPVPTKHDSPSVQQTLGFDSLEACDEKKALAALERVNQSFAGQKLSNEDRAKKWTQFYNERLTSLGQSHLALKRIIATQKQNTSASPLPESILGTALLTSSIVASKKPLCALLQGQANDPNDIDPKRCFNFNDLPAESADVMKGYLASSLETLSGSLSGRHASDLAQALKNICGKSESNLARSLCLVSNVLGTDLLDSELLGTPRNPASGKSVLMRQLQDCRGPGELGEWIVKREQEMRGLAKSCGSWESRVIGRLGGHTAAHQALTEIVNGSNVQKFVDANFLEYLSTTEREENLGLGKNTLPNQLSKYKSMKLMRGQQAAKGDQGGYDIYSISVEKELAQFLASNSSSQSTRTELAKIIKDISQAKNLPENDPRSVARKDTILKFCDNYVNPRYSFLVGTIVSAKGLEISRHGFKLPNGTYIREEVLDQVAPAVVVNPVGEHALQQSRSPAAPY